MNFKNKRITIMGIGTLGGGVGSARFFAEKGARVLVTDVRTEKDLAQSMSHLSDFKNIEYVLGEHREQDFIEADMVIRNPAVPEDSPFLQIAQDNHVPIEMAESLFLKLSPTKHIIGVTGTRGKSTTSAMIFHILKKAGRDVYLAGNQKDTSTLSLLNEITNESYVVLELSSWQLESFAWHERSPHIAVVTNIYPDHLNRYESMKQYIQAKSNIFLFQNTDDYLIVNSENEQTTLFAKEARSKVVWFSSKTLPEDISLSVSGGQQGGHNRANAGAAYAACSVLHIPDNTIKEALANFRGLPGRLEHLGIINGATVINDTTSTTPIAGVTAIESIQPDKEIVLIVGGNSKNLPIDDLVFSIKHRVKGIVYLKGTGTDLLQKELEHTDIPSAGPFETMDETIRTAFGYADPGDVILFSPSFTSFGQFNNEFHRGEVFTHAAHKTTHD